MRRDTFYDQVLRRVPVLTADEEHELTRRYATSRDPKDADRLVLANLRLVFSVCTELSGRGRADFMDLVQEGSAGLVEAVKRFDPGRGVKLATYARWWIRAYVLRHLMETSHIVDPGSTREGRRNFFARSLPPDLSLDAPVCARADEGGAAVKQYPVDHRRRRGQPARRQGGSAGAGGLSSGSAGGHAPHFGRTRAGHPRTTAAEPPARAARRRGPAPARQRRARPAAGSATRRPPARRCRPPLGRAVTGRRLSRWRLRSSRGFQGPSA